MAASVFDKYRIVLLASEGLSMGQIAEVMGIAKSVVTYVVNKWRRTGFSRNFDNSKKILKLALQLNIINVTLTTKIFWPR
jgi:transposase